MPDCRAYEMVTPPYEGGQLTRWYEHGTPPISANGEHLLGFDPGGFAGTENLELLPTSYQGAIYEFSRTPTGWSDESLEPPASEYPRREFFFASADFTHSLWGLELPAASGEEASFPEGNDETLAIREATGSAKARFTTVGPVASPEHEVLSREADSFEVVGASADLSHILLSVKAEAKQLWPGDTTQAGDESLYEYRGTDAREPVLVGVSNDGPLAGEPRINDDAEMVSECGTVLGSARIATTRNAVSADGETVYFTALAANPGAGPVKDACNEAGEGYGPPVNELYARVDGKETVDISEPTTGPEGDCEECKETEPKPAVFEGASDDGSKVFFLSEQELLPGARGESLYEYDFHAGNQHKRVTLVGPEVTEVAALSGNGGRVYFQSKGVLATVENGNGERAGEIAGGDNLYAYDTEGEAAGRTTFVAGEADGGFETTADGQYLVFEATAPLRGTNDTSTAAQLFEYNAETTAVARVSAGQHSPAGYECEATRIVEEGFNCDGNTANSEDSPAVSSPEDSFFDSPPTAATSDLSVSNGGDVAFTSRDALTPYAVPGGENVYEYGGGDAYLIAPGDETPDFGQSERGERRLLGIDESGGDIFLSSADRLVPQDEDTTSNWYDARIGGGFPAPPSAPSCLAAACQGSVSVAPQLPPQGGSETASAGGNLTLPVEESTPATTLKAKPKAKRCKKGFVKHRGKCKRKPHAARKAKK
jgi:hypothetical protein